MLSFVTADFQESQWSSYDRTWFSEPDKQEILILILILILTPRLKYQDWKQASKFKEHIRVTLPCT
jgi:hypothetical protein